MQIPTLATTTQQSLSKNYVAIRKYSENLCAPLQIEDYIPQPVAFASPPKWHLAHTTWFFEEFVLKIYHKNYKTYHPHFSYLFNSYYNAIGDRIFRADRGNITRPNVKEVYAYREYVDEAMSDLLNQLPLSKELSETIILGLNHEQQHQELLITDLKYSFGHNPIFPVYQDHFSLVEQFNAPQDKGFVHLSEGVYVIGHQGTDFHYDNELGVHKTYLQDVEIAKALVTNGEFMAFMNDEGYNKSELWLDEGWTWVKKNDARAPLYWHKIDGEWHYYTLNGLKKVNPDAILCHINFYEAAAYAEWKGMRLPTEFEWEVAADNLNWGTRWEWTYSSYLPYPGFATVEGAIGEYNGKFMINQMVLRGASSATSPNHSRKTYRNFFQTHLQWQCTGIRLCNR